MYRPHIVKRGPTSFNKFVKINNRGILLAVMVKDYSIISEYPLSENVTFKLIYSLKFYNFGDP